MFVADKKYLKAYLMAFLFVCVTLIFFFVLGVIYNSVIEVLIIVGVIMFFIVIGILYNLPVLSKCYIDNKKAILKCGRLYKKEISLDGTQKRSVELTMSMGIYAKNIFKGKYIVIANSDVDIDKVLHWTGNDLLKCLREKGVVAIPCSLEHCITDNIEDKH